MGLLDWLDGAAPAYDEYVDGDLEAEEECGTCGVAEAAHCPACGGCPFEGLHPTDCVVAFADIDVMGD